MLHLLPIRLILWALAVIAAVCVGGVIYADWAGGSSALAELSLTIRWAGSLVTIATVLLFAAWRWVGVAQRLIFPYLGGSWSGTVEYEQNGELQSKKVDLEIKHLLTGITMILESEESTSRTLVVHAEKDQHFDRYRLYYAYLNERKEGFAGGGDRYRGLAVIRVELGQPKKLIGDYFTETSRQGTLRLEQIAANPWWKLWR